MRKLILLSFLFLSIDNFAQITSASSLSSSSVSRNKYLVKINPAVNINVSNVSIYMKQICATNLVNYNSTSGYFEVLTTKTLERNIIDGKLQKNATPMIDYIFVGEVKVMLSTNNSDVNAE